MSESPADQRDLLYGEDEMQNLVFVPREIAREVRLTRERLPGCGTWKDARAALPARVYRLLVDDLVAKPDQPPPEGAALWPDGEMQHGEWPSLRYSEIEQWLPPEIFDVFGQRYDSMMSSGWNLPATTDQFEDQVEAIVAWLTEHGYRCEEDLDLPELFDPSA